MPLYGFLKLLRIYNSSSNWLEREYEILWYIFWMVIKICENIIRFMDLKDMQCIKVSFSGLCRNKVFWWKRRIVVEPVEFAQEYSFMNLYSLGLYYDELLDMIRYRCIAKLYGSEVLLNIIFILDWDCILHIR